MFSPTPRILYAESKFIGRSMPLSFINQYLPRIDSNFSMLDHVEFDKSYFCARSVRGKHQRYPYGKTITFGSMSLLICKLI